MIFYYNFAYLIFNSLILSRLYVFVTIVLNNDATFTAPEQYYYLTYLSDPTIYMKIYLH
jgi:hypothetical protein